MKPKPKDIDVDPRKRRPVRGVVKAQILDAAEPILDAPHEDGAAESNPPNGS